jgi:O-antigen/teichoic acid export membrane protein
VEALLKQVPYFRGKNDSSGLHKVEESVFATMVLSAVILSVLFLAFGWCLPFKFVQDNLLLAQITASAAAISFFRAFYYQRCAAYEDFKSVSMIDSLQSLAGITFVLLFAWKWGLAGGVVGYFVGEGLTWVAAGYICSKAHGSVRPRFQAALMGSAVRVGFPITIIWWVYALQATVGRVISISFLGNTQTGYYGVATSLAMLFALVPNTVGRVFYPRVNAQVGRNTDLRGLRESVVIPASAIALLLPIAQLIVFYLLPVVYNDFLPKYREGLTSAQILILGAFFVGLIRNGANYLIAVNMQMRLMKYVIVSLAAHAVGCIIAVRFGFGINGVAVAASLASALLASLVWQRVFAELEYGRKSRWSLFANFYLSLFGALASIVIVNLGFSGISGYSHALLPVKIISALGICGLVIMSFTGTRDQSKDLYRRALAYYSFRFKQADAK